MSKDDTRPGVTRRGFLVGASLTTAATAAAATLEACVPGTPGSADPSPVIGPGAVNVTLDINGSQRRVALEPRTTLADALRDELGLTGTKIGCDRGSCSACTVWLDGTPVCGCMTFALDAAGHKITTIEGLAAPDGTLHPVQQAFIDHDALQCGFCTPGMVMSCAALLARTSSPSLDDVRTATSGNLCRCGTYPKVFAATLAAARASGHGRRNGGAG
jgi:aerobic-type carbon monoxide dehydrogenase small subunit (CoxS/CutS family)